MPLYTIFKDLVFQSLSLVLNNVDIVLSCPKCILYLLSTNQSHTLEKCLISCFSISIALFSWRTIIQYHQCKVTSHWQQLGANHLYKLEIRVDVK